MKEEKSSKNELELVTKEIILNSLTREFQSVNNIAFKIKEIKHSMDYYYMQLKLMDLERKGLIESEIINNQKHYRIKD